MLSHVDITSSTRCFASASSRFFLILLQDFHGTVPSPTTSWSIWYGVSQCFPYIPMFICDCSLNFWNQDPSGSKTDDFQHLSASVARLSAGIAGCIFSKQRAFGESSSESEGSDVWELSSDGWWVVLMGGKRKEFLGKSYGFGCFV